MSVGLAAVHPVGALTDTDALVLVRRNMSPFTRALLPTRSSLAALRLTVVASTLAVPDLRVSARCTSMPKELSSAPSISDNTMSPALVLASKALTANSSPVMPLPALSVSTLATRSTSASAPPSLMLPNAVRLMLPAELTLVGAACSVRLSVLSPSPLRSRPSADSLSVSL